MKSTSNRWQISIALILSGAINAFIFIVRTPFFWEINRFQRLLFLLIGALIFSTIYLLTFSFLKKNSHLGRKTFLLILVITYLLFCCYLLLTNDLPKENMDLWLNGRGLTLTIILDKIFFFIIILGIAILCKPLFKKISSLTSFFKEKHIYDTIFLCSFLLLCIFPLINLNDIHALDENFWGRDALIKTFQSIRVKIGDRVFEKTIRSDDDWLIYTGELSIQDFQNTIPLSENQLNNIYSNLDNLNSYLQSKGISLLVVIPPNKNTIYPEYMSDEIPIIGKTSRLDQVINYQKEHNGVEILDLRPVLLKAKNDQLVFDAKGTHWNLYGSFLGYQEIIKSLNRNFPNLKPYDIDHFEFLPQEKTPGELANMAKIEGLEIQYELDYKDLDTIEINEVIYYYGENKSNQIPLTIYTSNDESLQDVFVYHDSFSNNLKLFLPLNFHKTTFLYHKYNDLEFSQIESEKPDIVIIEFNERYLSFLLTKLPN